MSNIELSISIIIPIFNEEENIELLYKDINTTVSNNKYFNKKNYEIIFVNDGSKDNSLEILKKIQINDSACKVLDLSKNYGQTAAMSAGINYSSGEIIIFIDADLQNDSKDIPKMIDKLNESYDLVNGWRKNRKDKKISRIIPSFIANWLISKFSGLKLHDYGCTLKVCRADILKQNILYGEMHRFIPLIVFNQGGKVCEIVVNHHPRRYGQTKYGISRTYKVISDFILLRFMQTYYTKPIHLFGGFGIINFILSVLIFIWMIILKLYFNTVFSDTPLPLLTVLFFLIGIMSFFFGFISEILMRTYHESQNIKSYRIKNTFD